MSIAKTNTTTEDEIVGSPFDFDVTICKTIGTIREGDKPVYFDGIRIGAYEAAMILIARNTESGEYRFTVPNASPEGGETVKVTVAYYGESPRVA